MTSYQEAAIVFWSGAGEYLYEKYREHREMYFPELPEELPIVIGITAYGHCHGLTDHKWNEGSGPRITIESRLFGINTYLVDDVLLHEMLHAWLHVTGQKIRHDSGPWYQAVRRLSPAVLGREVEIERGHGGGRKSQRMPNPAYEPGNGQPKTVVRKVRIDQAITHDQVATWPGSFRLEGYPRTLTMPCPSY
jgi:hypothetical protein